METSHISNYCGVMFHLVDYTYLSWIQIVLATILLCYEEFFIEGTIPWIDHEYCFYDMIKSFLIWL